ncbi:MAG: hypothetical protein WAN22_01660 [Solirubrobacteraceae bacterium]
MTTAIQERGGGLMPGATLIAPAAPLALPSTPSTPDPRRTYSCPECEHVLRVSGVGRHRVYFELADERSSDPVMTRVCPACGHGLPGKNTP